MKSINRNETENHVSPPRSPDGAATASAGVVPDVHCPAPEAPQKPPPRFPQAEGESDRAFDAFRIYLELGPQRRYAAVSKKVGAALITVKRWAVDFDWRGRIKSYAAECAEQYAETENAVQREQFLDAAARAKAFRDRQYALADAVLDAAERYLERMEDCDLDQMNFADACKALEVASRLGQRAESGAAGDSSEPARALRDQLSTLLDQVFRDGLPQKNAVTPAPLPTQP